MKVLMLAAAFCAVVMVAASGDLVRAQATEPTTCGKYTVKISAAGADRKQLQLIGPNKTVAATLEMEGFTDELQSVHGSHRAQHMGGIGALLTTHFQESLVAEMAEHFVQEQVLGAAFHQAGTKSASRPCGNGFIPRSGVRRGR